MKRVLIITVHFNNGSDIERFVSEASSLSVPAGWKIEIVVVDNSGGAPSLRSAELFSAPRNLGYAGGAAFGAEQWLARGHELPEWIGVVNADVAFGTDAIAALVSAPLSDDVVAVAPSILLGGTSPQNPFLLRRPSRARMWLYTVIFRSRVLTRLADAVLAAKRRRAAADADRAQRAIYAAHGSAFFLRKEFFERGATLRYEGFMFGEEIHIAEQARSVGGIVMYVPAAEAVHLGSATTSRIAREQRRKWHLESALILWRRYFRRRGA